MEKLIYAGLGILVGALGIKLFTPASADVDSSHKNADEIGGEAPAYIIVTGTVNDREAFMSGYVAHLGPLYERHGGHYIALGGNPEILEGAADPSFVVSKWPNADAARAFWNDPEYQSLKQARIDNNWGRFDVMLIDGLSAPVQANPAVSQAED